MYALACVLFECLAGGVPFEGDSKFGVMFAHLQGERPSVSERVEGLPPAIDAALARGMALSPEERYSSCGELIAEARLVLLGDGQAGSGVEQARAPIRAVAARNPYKGLRAFGEADADDFSGREALAGELRARLAQGARLTAVVGPSGSGKSSVVSSGLLPLVRGGSIPGSERWRIVEVLPGAHPFEELEAALLELAPGRSAEVLVALREGGGGLVKAAARLLGGDPDAELRVVVDQFEELFTMVDDAERRESFLELLETAARDGEYRVRIVLTLRADFYDRPLRYSGFSNLVEDGTVAVHPLTVEELRRAIVEPARDAGLEIDEGLVAEVVADVQGQPGGLPLLQYALSELYDHRDDGRLTREAYTEIGGISGALASRADELYRALEPGGQEAARRLFTRLVSLGEGVEDTRRRILRSEVDAIEDAGDSIDTVIDTYGSHRLLSFDRDPITRGPTVEIAHEALLREWPRLRGWIDEDRDGLRLLRHLSDAAAAWDRLGRDQGELYRGARLEQALAWQAEHPEDLNPLESQFLDASRELKDAEERVAQEQIQHRSRQNRRLRIVLAIVALALAGAVAGAIVVFDQRSTANEQTDRAEAEAARANEEAERATTEAARADEQTVLAQDEAERATAEAARADEQTVVAQGEAERAETARAEEAAARSEAESGRLVAEASSRVDDDRRLALLLAAEAHRRAATPEAVSALQRVLVGHGGFQGYLGSGGEYVGLEFSADGERLIALANGTIEVYDLATRMLIAEFEIEPAIVSSPQAGGRAAFLGQGGEEAAVATATGEIVVYNVADGSAVAMIRPDGATVAQVALAPSGGRVAVGNEDGTVSIWNRDGTGRPVRFDANGQARGVTKLAFNPDGTLPVTAGTETPFSDGATAVVPPQPARMWDTASGAQVGADLPLTPEDRLLEDIEPLASVRFSADGETLITSGPRTLRRWSVPSGELLTSTVAMLMASDPSLPVVIQGLATLPAGQVVVALETGIAVLDGARLEAPSSFVDPQVVFQANDAIAASADGSLFALGGAAGIFVWSPSGQQLLARAFPTGTPGIDFVFPLDENRIIWNAELGSPDRGVLWDVSDPNPQPVPFTPSFANATGFGERFFHMAYFEPDQPFRAEVWDKQTLAYTGVDVQFVIIANDLERGLLIGAFENVLYVQDADTGELIEQHEGFVNFFRKPSFNADRTRMITAVAAQSSATLWDTETWEHVTYFQPSDGNGVTAARFAPSGELVTVDPSGTIVVRDPETLEPIGAPMIGPASFDLEFNGDGTRLMSHGLETTLWDMATRTRIGDAFPVDVMWPGPDAKDRALGVEGDNVLIWNLNPDDWYDVACRAAGRNMTRAEWEEIGPRDAEYQATCPQFPLGA